MFTKELDTIAAISTPLGEGAISIVRLSGADALTIADRVFRGEKLTKATSHTIHYGKIVEEEEILDEVLVSVMRAPRTFTREDVVEINTHGGIAVTQQILQLLIRCGARLAEPGEFTKRAFLNGRIDLAQAESVMDIIRAKTDMAASVAVKQLTGGLSDLIGHLRSDILALLAQVEVAIDYPEYDDAEKVTTQLLRERLGEFRRELEKLISTAKNGKILREGLKTAIIGRPNVGKSSLLNRLLREDKAIVTNIPGTTRDTISEYAAISGIPLELIDTAGIRETADQVEKIGVERAMRALGEAELVLLVLDASSPLTAEDLELLALTADTHRIVLLNKTDLPEKIDSTKLPADLIRISALKVENLETLETRIQELFFDGQTMAKDATVLSNARHISLVEQALGALQEAEKGLTLGLPVDLIQVDVTRCWQLLGEITGEGAPDELITALFSQFCLGK